MAGQGRLEVAAFRKGIQDALAGGGRGRHIRHLRDQIRHHDRARELPRRVRDDSLQHLAVAKVDVPVVGLAYDEAGGIIHVRALINVRGLELSGRPPNSYSCQLPPSSTATSFVSRVKTCATSSRGSSRMT